MRSILRTAALFALTVITHAGSCSAPEHCQDALTREFVITRDPTLGFLIEGERVRRVALPQCHQPGQGNLGIWRARLGGQAVILKRTPHPAASELKQCVTGFLIGGPRMIGVGCVHPVSPTEFQFMVMEELFPNQTTFTLKGFCIATNADRARMREALHASDAATPPLRQLAHWLARGYIHGVMPPFDFDFIFTRDNLRLIDVDTAYVVSERGDDFAERLTRGILHGPAKNLHRWTNDDELYRKFLGHLRAEMTGVLTRRQDLDVVHRVLSEAGAP